MQLMRYDDERKRWHNRIGEVKDEEIIAPEKFKTRKGRLLRANCDAMANSDKELRQIQTVEMWIDTGDLPPIILRPDRTLIYKKLLVQKMVKDMQESGMIERYESPWSFLIVVVNKIGGHRFCADYYETEYCL